MAQFDVLCMRVTFNHYVKIVTSTVGPGPGKIRPSPRPTKLIFTGPGPALQVSGPCPARKILFRPGPAHGLRVGRGPAPAGHYRVPSNRERLMEFDTFLHISHCMNVIFFNTKSHVHWINSPSMHIVSKFCRVCLMENILVDFLNKLGRV